MKKTEILTEKLSPVYRYLEYLPRGYTSRGKSSFPLILFLHGAGERGNNIEKVKHVGLPPVLMEHSLPFVVIAPQCPLRDTWAVKDVELFLTFLLEKYNIDESRLYLTGISMGGYATWYMAGHLPDTFAAIAPICGGGNIAHAKKMIGLPVWAFHGGKDNIVPPERSKKMVDELKKLGGNVRYTVYPDAGHDSWTRTYNNPELYKWFLEHRRT
ncbi:MAG: prolyl oligopeptidase family serine peptidase [Spirochaetota bacterium]